MSFRFLHSVGPNLDGHLQDIPESVGDAPRQAWDHLVTAALDEEVDFLLLQGKLLFGPGQHIEEENGLGRRDLVRGLELLEGIPVFVTDSSPNFDWPEGIEVLQPGQPVKVTRSGRAICTLHPESARIPLLIGEETKIQDQQVFVSRPVRDPGPGSIFVAIPDNSPDRGSNNNSSKGQELRHSIPLTQFGQSGYCYMAFEEETGAAVARKIHFPGQAQPLSSMVMGEGEVSIVQVAPPKEITVRKIPVATVRYFTIEIQVSRGDSLRALCQQALSRITRTSCDRYWIVTWLVRGAESSLDLEEFREFPSHERKPSLSKLERGAFQVPGVNVLSNGFFLDEQPVPLKGNHSSRPDLFEDSLAGQYLDMVESICGAGEGEMKLVKRLARHWGIKQLTASE